uniref:hypothetical protein n=1 Tax=Metabacillus halosaccharovorans TaxID=930124 RepID=UPI003736D0CE
GIYGLASANGLSEYITGKDMFGNELTDIQRQSSLYNSILGASLVVPPLVPTLMKNGKLVKEETLNQLHKLATKTKSGALYVYDEVIGGMRVFLGNQNMNFAYAGAEGIKPLLSNVMNSQEIKKRVEEAVSRFSFGTDLGGSKGSGDGVGVIIKGSGNTNDITKLTVDDIPTAKSGNFNEFFNSLTSRELDELWQDKKIRKKIERQLRAPGGLHEWHLVSRAPQFKHWNISAEDIKDLRTAISDVKFVNPNGVHGGLGSTKAHNELLAIIDTSKDYNTFVRRLNNWANYRLDGGISSLPEGLRLE